MKDVTVEGILYALSDPVRVQIFADMVNSECPQKCCHFQMVDNRALPKSTLSQHFKVLRESGLIRSERKGVEMHSTSRCMELKDRFGPMITAIIEAYAQGRKKKPAKR